MSIDSIQKRIDDGKARVYTASELKRMVAEGRTPGEVDVVTCGTFGVMSGTMAVFTIPVCGPGIFRKAERLTLNGVPAVVGPCPNESLGIVDCIVYGTARRDPTYGGGHLFRDIVAGLPIEVRVESEGKEYDSTVTIDEIPFARMVTTRSAFMNYTGFVNKGEPRTTIFSGPEPMPGNLGWASVSGCGEINPLQNDPGMRYIHEGASVLLNGAPGMVIGTGTRSTPGKPNLSVAADMHDMDPTLMGGFITSEGPECLTSVGVAIPIVDEEALRDVSILDRDIPLPLTDVSDRVPVCEDTYEKVWGSGSAPIEDRSVCLDCPGHPADRACPVGAHPCRGIDRDVCVSCGICGNSCVNGTIRWDPRYVNYLGQSVRIGVVQSSRDKAERICDILKEKVENGEWKLRFHDRRG